MAGDVGQELGARAVHWDQVYARTPEAAVSWFQRDPAVSLRLLDAWAPADAAVVDVGAGRSRLADALLQRGRADITLVDVSAAALAAARGRLASAGDRVQFVHADICAWDPPRTFGAWHDRAVFHFLTAVRDRDRYVACATRAVAPGGVMILGTFAADGPTQCSGLPVARYEPPDLAACFAETFVLAHHERELHVTPTGRSQAFTWAVLRRIPEAG